jgi:positive regulator of sigma E activity
MLKIWVVDPETKKPSVSLTLLVVSVILFVGLGILDVLGKIKGIGVFSEFMFTAVALYFGRRLDFNKFISKRNNKNG